MVAVVGALFLEVTEVGFWFWYSKRRRIEVGAETLIGAVATVVTPCRPRGQVRVGGETWDAVCEGGADLGDRVRVVGRESLTLLVEPH